MAKIMDIDIFHSSTGLPDFRSIGISGYGLNIGYHQSDRQIGIIGLGGHTRVSYGPHTGVGTDFCWVLTSRFDDSMSNINRF